MLPDGARVSVTCSPAKGVDATMALAARLQRRRPVRHAACVGPDGP